MAAIFACSSAQPVQPGASVIELPSSGCLRGDCINGNGTYVWKNGDTYAGQWRQGQRHGNGEMVWRSDSIRQQRIGASKSAGSHVPLLVNEPYSAAVIASFELLANLAEECKVPADAILSADVTYRGQWKNGKRHGIGTLFLPNGIMLRGRWENDEYKHD